jgi:hypothetical protein
MCTRPELSITSACHSARVGRPTTISLLRAYMSARTNSPEEQATAVLAAAMRTDPKLTDKLLERVVAGRTSALVIDTEVATGVSGSNGLT